MIRLLKNLKLIKILMRKTTMTDKVKYELMHSNKMCINIDDTDEESSEKSDHSGDNHHHHHESDEAPKKAKLKEDIMIVRTSKILKRS